MGGEICKKTRTHFKFRVVNVPIGSTLTFVPTCITVNVADANKIEYEGRLYKSLLFNFYAIRQEQHI